MTWTENLTAYVKKYVAVSRFSNCLYSHKHSVSAEVVEYGRECFQNFNHLELQMGGFNGEDSQKFDYFAEVNDSDFEVVSNSDGTTSYEVCLPESAFTPAESSSDSQGDFILKIKPTHTESPPTFVKITSKQMIFDHEAWPCRIVGRCEKQT